MQLLRYGNCQKMHANMRTCTIDQKVKELVKEDDGQKLINLTEEVFALI